MSEDKKDLMKFGRRKGEEDKCLILDLELKEII